MKLKTNMTHNFIELSVDEIDETIFKGEFEVDETIINLLDVIDDLMRYTDKNFNEELEQLKE
jgi:L-ribulose-5-phosphate 3-epimerase UlaE